MTMGPVKESPLLSPPFRTKTDALPKASIVPTLIEQECNDLRDLLLSKNRKYGNSALEPSRIFSRADAVEQIKVRLDDKITRLKNAQDDEDEDVVQDLMGYLVLLRIAKKLRDADSTARTS